MKKWIAVLLVLTMLLSAAGCGAQPQQDAPETGPTTQPPTQAPTEETTVPPTTEPPVTEPDHNDFDKLWAGEDLEMPIPAPPFAAEVEYEAEKGRYTITSTDDANVKDIDIQLFKDYCETLKAIGFADSLREGELEAGEGYVGYEFYGERNGSQCVMLINDGRSCMILVIIGE